jgi:hypothetical protein
METEIRNLRSKRELIPKTLVQKQAAFLVLSLRARLLAIPAQHADELLGISNRHEMTRRLDSIIRSTLETLAEMPLKVTDEHWMQKLDDVEHQRSARSQNSSRRAPGCPARGRRNRLLAY